jgi:hypothetical protein
MPRVVPDALAIKPFLKRGALVAAANWQVILLQFIAESAFKILLAVPIVAAACLAALLIGESALDLATRDARQVLSLLLSALAQHPGALACYLLGTVVTIAGGAVLTFLAKGGTVAVLVRAERHAPAVEDPPLRLAVFRRAEQFRLERFSAGARRLFPRYLRLGLTLMGVYGGLALAYVLVIYGSYRVVASTGLLVGWTLVAAGLSGVLVLAITVVNLLYLLAQIVVAADNCTVAAAASRVAGFLRREYRLVGLLFMALLIIVSLATVASVLATASLGVIGFIPVLGLAVLPIQVMAWLARGLVFQYLGLTALCAYVRLYRGTASERMTDARRLASAPSPAS